MLLPLLMLLGCLEAARGQCDTFRVLYQKNYQIFKSPLHPYNYQPNTLCSWRFRAWDSSYGLKLTCSVYMPKTNQCTGDRLLVTPTGEWGDDHLYCGTGTFTLFSERGYFDIELRSMWNSMGGRFQCRVDITEPYVEPTVKPTVRPDTCRCGWKKQTRIVGGKETGINEFPFMAGLIDIGRRQLFCGSTIVSKWYVLTAAHCLIRKQPSGVTVLVGDHDIQDGTETNAAKLYGSSEFISHERYNNRSQANDIALIKVKEPIEFSDEVMPACLPFRYTNADFTGRMVTILGWGAKQFGSPASNVLLKTELEVTKNTKCIEAHGDKITDNQMCTYTKDRDSCQSDSGGPLLWQDSQTARVYVVGIISYGIGCATEAPSVNTRVPKYMDWMEARMQDDNYCYV